MNREDLLEEYADCLIVMEWVKEYYDLSDEEIKRWLDKKNERNRKKNRRGGVQVRYHNITKADMLKW